MGKVRGGGWGWKTPFLDAVWCCEVVEHIDEQYLDNLLRTLTQGRVLLMTHAFPYQSGHHHVNCQKDTYWIEHIRGYGMNYDPLATEESREVSKLDCLDANGYNHWVRSGLIFVRA